MAMDSDLITLVNKLQDTFSNLGTLSMLEILSFYSLYANFILGGDLDMPQIAVVCILRLINLLCS